MRRDCDGCPVAAHVSPATGPRSGVLPGVSDATIARLLIPVAPRVAGGDASIHDTSTAADAFARAVLGAAIEPGDQEAGRLVEALGPVELVRAIVDDVDARRVVDLLTRHADGFVGERPFVVPAGAHADPALALVERPESSLEPRPPAPADYAGGRAERRIADCLARWRSRLSLGEAIRVLERAARIHSQLLTPHSPFWPEGFASLEAAAPLALWVRGDAQRLHLLARSIALVGARASTQYGEHVAMEAAAGLSDRGFAIVSGGAYGIDAAAHRATLASGGVTVAFLAGGVDRLYPAGNSELLRRVASDGVLASELPPGSTPTRWRFLMRNRLIAASATATVVVEAGHRSGSLNTAGHAAQLGRPLGAVPGSILSPASAGSHRLIREYAATCVTTVEEMAELADPLGEGQASAGAPAMSDASAGAPAMSDASASLSDAERSVLGQLSRSRETSADEIAVRAALPFTTVAAVLGRLDLAGRARERAGGWTLVQGKR